MLRKLPYKRAVLALALPLLLPVLTACAGADVKPTPPSFEPRNLVGIWERFPPDSFGQGARRRPAVSPVDVEPIHLKEPYAGQFSAMKNKRAAAMAAGAPLVDNSNRCLPEGMPRVMTATYPIQIVQTPGEIIVLAEIFTQTRRIWMDAKIPSEDEIEPLYYGFSVGRWEGNTLVVKTFGVRKDVDFFDIPHSDKLVITERIEHVSDGVLENKVTMEDPVVLEKPFNFKVRYKRINYKMSEYFCENNHIVEDSEGRAIYDPARIGPKPAGSK